MCGIAGYISLQNKPVRNGKDILDCPHPEYSKKFFDLASKYAEITTITPSGKGSFLPSVTYTELTGSPSKYRENHELTDLENLKIFSNWKGYII